MNRFLTMKHWQLFAILTGPPLLFHLVAYSDLRLINSPGRAVIFFPVITLLFGVLYLAWLYSLGINLYGKLPRTAKMNLRAFRILLLVPVSYMAVIACSIIYIATRPKGDNDPHYIVFFLIGFFHLLSMFGIFYSLYFTAKALKSAEVQRPATFSDYAGEFFLLWFFPVGIWFLQPRINRLFAASPDQDGT